MRLIPLSKITIPSRQRKSRDPSHVRELEESIAQRGLLHAPGGWYSRVDDTFVLSWGETRHIACANLHRRGVRFRHDGVDVPPGELPFTLLDEELSASDIFETELHENIIRRDISWQDKTQAFADLHALRLKENPKQGISHTGQELSAKTGLAVGTARNAVAEAVQIAEHLSNPKIANARNAREARSLILKGVEEKLQAEIARRTVLNVDPVDLSIQLRHADMLETLELLDPKFVDLICVDPPTGTNAGSAGFRGRTVHHHNYEDTPERAKEIMEVIMREGFRVTKDRANIFIFGHIDNWIYWKECAARHGWSPFPRPLIWGKSDSEGLAPWGGAGPRITTEYIFYATKGKKGLHASPVDYLRVNRVSRSERIHAAEKPVELMRKLIECATLPDDFVLDPCCGSGSTLVAARELRRRGLGIEMDKDYFTTALANVYGEKNGD